MKFKQISLLLLVGVISGCALYGPSYNKPDASAPRNWSSKDSLAKVESGVSLPDTAWWSSFNDQELDHLIIDALANNNNIQQAIGNIIQAQGLLEQVKMSWIPTISGQVGYTSTQALDTAPNTPSTSLSSGSANAAPVGYSAGLIPGYSLNIFQQIRNQDAYTANLAAMQYAKNATRLSIISQVASSYFTLLGQDYQLSLQKSLTADTLKQLELGKDQYKKGYISLLTLQTYQQQYYNAVAQIPIVQNNIVQTENALQVLLNKNPGYVKRGNRFINIKIDGIIPSDLPSSVLKNRPDIMQAEEQLKQANANIGVATSSYFPNINLVGGLGSSSSSLSSLFSAGTNFWQQQLSVTMPFLNLSYLGTIKGAKGAYYTAYYNYILTVKTAFSQVDGGLSQHQKLTDSYLLKKQQYDSAKLAYIIGDQRYKEGADSYVTALNYKVTMDNAAITLTSSKLQQLQSIVTLYQYLAGGYNFNNTEKPNKFGDSHDS
ncbi:MAG: efflux transporter outer membrane subunit [Proteobacteria bacterium]|jgi:NodT family efflux transporter outer membrane factor (OMF) lipoprotein|nr:efflux transporter outer membrane subunit [Pseudomonadota bacterium]